MFSQLRFHRREPTHITNNTDADFQHATTSADQQQSLGSPLQAHSSGSSKSDTNTIATTATSISSPIIDRKHTPFNSSSTSPSTTAFPPTLPPITRVTSPIFTNDLPYWRPLSDDREVPLAQQDAEMSFQQDNRPQSQRLAYNTLQSGFIGGVALEKYRQDLAAQTQNYLGHGSGQALGQNEDDNLHLATFNTQTVFDPRQRPMPAPINTNVPLLHQLPIQLKSQSSFSTPTDLQSATSSSINRRSAGQRLMPEPPSVPVTSSLPEPPKGKKGLPFLKNPMSTLLMRRKNSPITPEPAPAPSNARAAEPAPDPSIRGTRVHDFSTPRRKHPPPTKCPILPPAFSQGELPLDHADFSGSAVSMDNTRHDASAAVSPHYPHIPEASGEPEFTRSSVGASASSSIYSQPSRAASQVQAFPSDRTNQVASSTRAVQSRKFSIASGGSITRRLSSIPKHMKSTSSRFSFDMVGGPAEQELIMEERHRQREAEKKINEPTDAGNSRYDDFDEDGFDYDAMMDDDGLEERIPGVNADWDVEDDFIVEDNLDPDNDQENFAGFVFQRSDGPSLLASHETCQPKPQDTDGNDDGLTTSVVSPGSLELSTASSFDQQHTSLSLSPSGLGIQDQVQLQSQAKDDIYFDDGIVGFENEFAEDLAGDTEGEPFDESIFDNNDTDQYGRPIAGAFAQAQLQRRAAKEQEVNGESGLVSQFSSQSETVQFTPHTSVGVPGCQDFVEEGSLQDLQSAPSSLAADRDIMEAYQAALAAAAHQAAASGKFNRSKSPSRERPQARGSGADFVESSPLDDDDFGYENMDDFELDDDAIIAEANASALANDSDGWYGQEFGFYAAPANQYSVMAKDGVEYEYLNGGIFGPKGMDGVGRSKSGRVINREPNLTPITERSEYSNRNSVISLAKGHMSWGTPIQSPGLAQLALIADRGDEMSLTALMRLRNRAWGGSQVSLASSKDGSPKSERGDISPYPWTVGTNGPQSGQLTLTRNGSFLLAMGQDSGCNGSISASPTPTAGLPASTEVSADYPTILTQGSTAGSVPSCISYPDRICTTDLPSSDNNNSHQLSAISSASQGQSVASPVTGRRPNHKHKNSAESISYTKEDDSGETRWVVERRRIAESGRVKSVKREIVEGRRI